MPSRIGKDAVVIGAGMGGLAAAKAVAPYFERVIVLDRDGLPDAPAPRVGTPQARHVHVLLASGERALEALFPGVGEDFLEAGATKIRAGRDLVFEQPGYDPFPRRDLGFDMIALSRPAIERICRRRLEEDPKVEIRSLTRVAEIIPTQDRRAVAGVRCEDAEDHFEEFAADLVVDASGRGAPTLSFLQRVGAPKPDETEIGVDVGYASAIFEPSSAARDWLGLAHLGSPPDKGFGGLIFPIENGRWLVSLGRRPSAETPADIESFVAFARTLRTPTVYEALRTAKPVTGSLALCFPSERAAAFSQARRLAARTRSGRRFDLPVQSAVRSGHERRGS